MKAIHSSRSSDSESIGVVKPPSENLGKPVTLQSNHYKIHSSTTFYKYHMSFSPELDTSDESKSIKMNALRACREELEASFPDCIVRELMVYTPEKVDEAEMPLLRAVVDEVPYSISFSYKGVDPRGEEYIKLAFSKALLNDNIRLRTGSCCQLDPERKRLEGIDMHLRLDSTVKDLNGELFFVANPGVKFFQQSNVADWLYEDLDRRSSELIGQRVLTTYRMGNNYRVKSVLHDESPQSTFDCKGEKISYADYLNKVYKVKLQYPDDQPMLLCEDRRGKEVKLVPECCRVVGISEQQKARNFREIKEDLYSNAETKILQTKRFTDQLESSKDFKNSLAKLDMEVEFVPYEVPAYKTSAKTITAKVNGEKVDYKLKNLEKARDFSHTFDAPLRAKKIDRWCILHGASKWCEQAAESLVGELGSTISKDFKVRWSKPDVFPVDGRDKDSKAWRASLELCKDEGYQMVFCVAPGSKGSSPVYDAIKLFSFESEIVTQVVLESTINKGKSLRNVVKKIMEQVVAKQGGCPWGFKNLPIFKKAPTMVCGIDITHNVGKSKQSVLSFSATMQRDLGKYYSTTVAQDRDPKTKLVDVTFDLRQVFEGAIQRFIEINDMAPAKIIIYRDSVSEGQNKNLVNREVPGVT